MIHSETDSFTESLTLKVWEFTPLNNPHTSPKQFSLELLFTGACSLDNISINFRCVRVAPEGLKIWTSPWLDIRGKWKNMLPVIGNKLKLSLWFSHTHTHLHTLHMYTYKMFHTHSITHSSLPSLISLPATAGFVYRPIWMRMNLSRMFLESALIHAGCCEAPALCLGLLQLSAS